MSRFQRRYCYGILFVLLTVLCWTSSIPTQFLQTHTSVLPSSSTARDKGWEVIWYDSLYLTHIWGDDSSLFTGAKFYDSQSGWQIKLQKWDLNGNVLKEYVWNRDNKYERLSGIWGNSECICISGYPRSFNYTINEEIYTSSYIKKFDTNLELEWSVPVTNSVLSDIWCDNENIYTVGLATLENSTQAMLISQWDMNGQQVWNNTEPIHFGYIYSNYLERVLHIMGNSKSVYTDYMRSSSSDFIHTLSKWNFNGTKEWNKTLIEYYWLTYGYGFGPAGDFWVGENHIFRMQEFTGLDEEFRPYKEDLALQKWDTDGNMIWQKDELCTHVYNEGYSIPCTQIWGNGTDVYLCTDKFRERIFGGTTDLYLIHFDKNGEILEEKTWNYDHNLNVISILLWGNNESLYSGGEIRIKTDYANILAGLDRIKYLIQWSDELNVPLIIGLSVGGIILFFIPISLLIFKRRQLKKNDTKSAQK